MDTALLVWQGGISMMRHLICRGLILGAVVAGSTGCETLRSSVRHDDQDEASQTDDETSPKAVSSDASKLKSVDPGDSDSQPFFSRNRSGSSFSGFSPEAQSIEKDLGVY
jgi:hypothetical protein